jgi:hypothetical protein
LANKSDNQLENDRFSSAARAEERGDLSRRQREVEPTVDVVSAKARVHVRKLNGWL